MEKVTQKVCDCFDKVLAKLDMTVNGVTDSKCGHEMAVVFDDVGDEDVLWSRVKDGAAPVGAGDIEMTTLGVASAPRKDELADYPGRMEIRDIRQMTMQFDQQGHYLMNHRFSPGDWYRFHVTAFMRGDRKSYLGGGWTSSLHKLMCRNCARLLDEEPIQDGDRLDFVDYTIQLRAGADGLISIPYYGRPSHYLAEASHFVVYREELVEKISKMYLETLGDKDFICWEFHCSRCYVNLFTKNVINVTGYVTKD
jgi:hypothetical protein